MSADLAHVFWLDPLLKGKIEEDANGCWIWVAASSAGSHGGPYGRVGRGGKVWRAHRWVWLLLGRTIPDGYHMDHLCRVTLCVNPDHLEPVTALENARRGLKPTFIRAIEAGVCSKGHSLREPSALYTNAGTGYRECRRCRNDRRRALAQERRRQCGVAA